MSPFSFEMSAPETLFEGGAGEGEGEGGGGLITVAVSLYNYHDDIGACLDSVWAQTYRRLELIVVDDCSTDGSAAAVADWLARRHSRFERALLLRHDRNRGLSATRNTGFSAAQGEEVFVLDADNLILPQAIDRLAESLRDSGAAVAYSQLLLFGASAGIGVADIWRADSFKRDNYIDAMALVRKDAWSAVGGYTDMEYGWEDYDFWCKFVEAGLEGVFVPELLCRYRLHLDSMRHTDTTHYRPRLVQAMMAAHPWLRLSGG